MNLFIMGLLLFIMAICVIELLTLAFRQIRSPQRAKLRKRLRKYIVEENPDNGADILRKRVLSEIPFLNRLLLRLSTVRRLDQLVIQSNAPYTLGFYVLLIGLLATFGFLFGVFFLRQILMAILLAITAGAAPLIFLRSKRHARIEKFRSQMPEGLELIARSLRAGHALPSGMKLAAEHFEDPLGPEFGETLDEINFGVSVADALKNLAGRMHCKEVGYFVVAVILQRETGGNLAELMESLGHLIRENYKFQGKVRTLSAEGRLSAVVLIALPFLIAGWIKLSSPAFLEPLLTEPVGRLMLMSAGVMMVLGIIVTRKMIKIDV
jgi:tight adherence protein B